MEITTDLSGLLVALGTTVEELRRDRRYAKVLGTERVVLATHGNGNQLHIMEAPAWLPCQDFGPIGVSWARRAGWL